MRAFGDCKSNREKGKEVGIALFKSKAKGILVTKTTPPMRLYRAVEYPHGSWILVSMQQHDRQDRLA